MRYYIVALLLTLFCYKCKELKEKDNFINKSSITDNTKKEDKDSILTIKNKKILQTTYSFQKLLSTVKDIEHTGNKHKDWMFNRARTLDSIFLLNNREYKVKTTSYEYKKNCVFYLHTIKHVNNNISIKPYLEKAQGRTTRGYTTERVLLFAMKNDIEANFIDIPPNWNHIDLADELLEILYKKVNSDIILCYRTKNCIYKDLRKNK